MTFFVLFRATLLLSVAFGVADVLLRTTRCRAWSVHRTTWVVVLLTGVLAMIPVAKTMEIAVLAPPPNSDRQEVGKKEHVENIVPAQTVEIVMQTPPQIPDHQEVKKEEHVENIVPAQTAEIEMLTPPSNPDRQEMGKEEYIENIVPALAEVCGSERGVFKNILFFVWLSGMVIIPLRQLFRLIRFHLFLREAVPASDEWSEAWRQLLAEKKIRKPIPMLVTENFGPALIAWRTALVVPLEGWDGLTNAERQSVMRHELEHYRRGDVWTSLFARLLMLPHWFNPLATLAVRRFEDAAEWACDDAALGQQGESLAVFAKALVSLQESAVQKPVLYEKETLFQHHISGRNISRRISRLLTFNAQNQKESIMKKVFLLSVCVLLLCTTFVQFRLVAQQKESPKEPETSVPETEEPDELKGLAPEVLAELREKKIIMPKGTVIPKDEYLSLGIDDLYKNRAFLNLDTETQELLIERLNVATRTWKQNVEAVKNQKTNRMTLGFSSYLRDAKIELFEILGDSVSLQKEKREQIDDWKQTNWEKDEATQEWIQQKLSIAERILKTFDKPSQPNSDPNTPNLLLEIIVSDISAQKAQAEMVAAFNHFLRVDIAFIKGEHGGKTYYRENARLAWLDARKEWNFRNGDLQGWQITMLEREDCITDLQRAAFAAYKTDVITTVKLNEAEKLSANKNRMTIGGQTFSIEDIVSLQKHNNDKNRPSVLMLFKKNVSQAYPKKPTEQLAIEYMNWRIRVTQEKLKILEETNKLHPGSITKLEMKKAELNLAEAKYELERLQSETPPQTDDELDVLQKNVNNARATFVEINNMKDKTGDTEAHTLLSLAEAEIRLYRFTGERTKQLAAIQIKIDAAKALLAWYKTTAADGTIPLKKINYAEDILAYAEYELKQVQEDKPVLIFDKPLSPWLSLFEENTPKKEAAAKPATKPLLFQGKTFEQWVDELQAELDPKLRGEAFRALAMFGANGRGKEATEIIFNAAKNYDFYTIDTDLTGQMKMSVIEAFSNRDGRIPLTDSMPVLLQKFSDGNKNEKYLVRGIFQRIPQYPEAKEFLPAFFETLTQWDMEKVDDKVGIGHPRILFSTMARLEGGEEYVLRFLKEAIAQNDARRFGWMFDDFDPDEKIKEISISRGGGRNYSSDRPSLFGLFPVVATNGLTVHINGVPKRIETAGLTPFGKLLLTLLQESGINSSNETIREASKKVVDTLLSVKNSEEKKED